jgi:hypothetical protein
MTIKRRGKRWSVEVYDASKASRKRYVGTFDTQQEARAAGRIAESEISTQRGRRVDTTVAEFAARWLELHPREKESTNIGYAQQIKPFVESRGALPLRDVTVDLALEWARRRSRDVQRCSSSRTDRHQPVYEPEASRLARPEGPRGSDAS